MTAPVVMRTMKLRAACQGCSRRKARHFSPLICRQLGIVTAQRIPKPCLTGSLTSNELGRRGHNSGVSAQDVWTYRVAVSVEMEPEGVLLHLIEGEAKGSDSGLWHLADAQRAFTACGIDVGYGNPRQPWALIPENRRCKICAGQAT